MIGKSATVLDESFIRLNRSGVNFGVLQSVADFQPDVDAIFRLTRNTPFSFQRPNDVGQGIGSR